MFYATFPAARDAAACSNAVFEPSIYDLPSPVDCPTFHYEATTQPLYYDSRNEVDICSTSSVSLRSPTQEQSYPPRLNFDYSEGLQQPFFPHHCSQPSYHPLSRPVSFFFLIFFVRFSTIVC